MNSLIETLNQRGGNFLSFAWPMLWQSSLLIVVLLTFDFALRRRLRASIRYALWLVVLAKLCLPPTLALPTSPAWWLHRTPPPVAAKAETHYTVTYDNAPLPEIPQTPLPAFAPPQPAMNFAAWLLAVSAAVSSALLCWLLLRWWQITRQIRRAETSERLAALADEAQRFVGMKFKVTVKLTANSMSPVVCGLFRPAVLIPQALVENFSDGQLRAVLLHELIHLRRRDVWLNFLQALLQIFYWWHPLLWVANARIRRVREEAVDDAVMLALRDEADGYASTLLEVAKLAFHRPLMSLGLVGIMESRSALRQRIERLVDFRAPRKAGLTFTSLCVIFVFSAVALPMGQGPVPAPKENAHMPVPANFATSASSQATNAALILVTAQFYEMQADDLKKLISGLQLNPGRAGEEPWWSAPPLQFRIFKNGAAIYGLLPISSPRIQTSSGTPAQMYIGDRINGIWFDCTPTVNGSNVDLAVSGKVVDGGQNQLYTNQFHANALVENFGGVVIRMNHGDGLMTSNLVAVIGVQLVTNSSAGNFQQRLVPLGKKISMDSPTREKELVQDGKLLFEMGKLDEAAEKFKAALALNPSNASALYYSNLVTQEKQTSSSPVATGPDRKTTVAKLDQIRLDRFFCDYVPLEEVLRQLTEEIRKSDPEKTGVIFLLDDGRSTSANRPAIDPATGLLVLAAIDLATGLPRAANAATNDASLRSVIVAINPGRHNIRLGEALDAIVAGANRPIRYSLLADGSVVFANGSPQSPLAMRTFRVDAEDFYAYLQTHGGRQTNGIVQES